MAHTRQTASRVPPEGSASQVPPEDYAASGCYSWIDDVMRDANSIVSKDDVAAYLASLPVPPSFEPIRLAMEEKICDRPRLDSWEDWFYMYDYCLTTLGVRMLFSTFQIRVLNSLRLCHSQFHPND
ncbi:hypothetical protein SESBI_10701 [Sesbania bispinosa]|nr:hypothetical protein SESBI_10701 [Sesbania bispinosa]